MVHKPILVVETLVLVKRASQNTILSIIGSGGSSKPSRNFEFDDLLRAHQGVFSKYSQQ